MRPVHTLPARRLAAAPWAALGAALMMACGESDPVSSDGRRDVGETSAANPQCLPLPLAINSTAVRKDGIPALSNPSFVSLEHPEASWVSDTTRVVGVEVAGTPLAIPLNILWWHEVVNVSLGGRHVAVTYCPLTGSSLVFDRQPIGGNELRVSGLLYDNNLIMFDRSTDESLWGQMLGQAICGPARGRTLPLLSSLETSFERWKTLHPETQVASLDTGHERDYGENPYEDYWRLDAPPLFEEVLTDKRLNPKELVLAVPAPSVGAGAAGDRGGHAIPFDALAADGRQVVVTASGDTDIAVFWDGPSRTAAAYVPVPETWPVTATRPVGFLTFDATDEGYVDRETGTMWDLEGRAVSGPGEGARLRRHTRSFVAFWFAWSVMRPDLEVWSADGA